LQQYLHTNKLSITTSKLFKKSGVLPDSSYHLVDKADMTQSPLGSSSNWGCLTGETNDFVSSYGFALTEQASVIRLIPRRSHCSPIYGAERNRTAVRNIG